MGLAATVAGSTGVVPPFRSGARDRASAGFEARVELRPVELRARWSWLADRTDAGGVVSGSGDLELGTVVTVAHPGPFAFTVGWSAKLPNAADEGELGTDETDIGFGASARWTKGPVALGVEGGLDVLGNPLRFANQDDVPVVAASAGWARGAWAVTGRSELAFLTARNPARAEGDVAVRWGSRWFALVHGGGGYVPAAADWHAGVAIGWSGALPVRPEGV